MSEIPKDLKYSQTHEWIEIAHDGIGTVGITDHAQDLLGDIVFVESPEAGATVTIEETCGVIESVKAASDIYAIVSGEVTEINADLEDSPESINNGAFTDGWIYRVKISDTKEIEELMSAEEYAEFIESEDH